MNWLNDLIVRIKGDTSHLDSTLSKSQSTVGSWAGKMAGFLKGAFAIGTIVQFGKMVVGASEDLNDRFTAAVAGAKGALREFFSTLATGDFSHFFANLKEGYDKANKLAQALDAFEDKKAYSQYLLSGKMATASGYEGIVKDTSGQYSLATRKEYAVKLKAIEQEIQQMTLDISKETFDLEVKAWENLNKMTADEAVKLYEIITGMNEKTRATLQRSWEYFMSISRNSKRAAKKLRASGTGGALAGITAEEKSSFADYMELMKKGETELIPRLFKSYQSEAEARDAAQTRFNGVLRITNNLLSQQLKVTESIIPLRAPAKVPAYSVIKQYEPEYEQVDPRKLSDMYVNKILGTKNDMTAGSELTDLQQQWLSGWQAVADEATAYMADAFQNLFERIGSGDFEGFGKDLLSGFGQLLASLGKMLVAFGTTMLLALTLAKTPSIPTAIAAIAVGASAIAIGGMMIGAASSGGSAMSGGGASGGGAGGQTASAGQIKIFVEGRIQGRDIYISNKRYGDEIGRNT